VYNAICPRSPKQLQEKLSDPIFLNLQIRRSQTEARIGIFKNWHKWDKLLDIAKFYISRNQRTFYIK
jgi:hypothetical protein